MISRRLLHAKRLSKSDSESRNVRAGLLRHQRRPESDKLVAARWSEFIVRFFLSEFDTLCEVDAIGQVLTFTFAGISNSREHG